jgi:hypothetical protein
MVGGLINIVSYGANDLYLTGAPQITFFKIMYRRYTNFSIESIALDLGTFNFNDEINIPFPKVGDLVSNTYLQINVPQIHFLRTDTAADLSTDEINILTTPFPIPLSAQQLEIINDYDTILNYIVYNMAGYRTAVQNQNVINQSPTQYIDTILASIGSTSNTNYINALERALQYETSIGNTLMKFILDYRNSDVQTILTNQHQDITSFTVSKIFNLIKTAVNTSTQVKDYYFKLTRLQHSLTTDSQSQYAKFAWINKLGHAIIDKIDVNIGGQRIDRHYGDWLNIWYELTGCTYQERSYNKLIGNIKPMTTFDRNAKPAYTLTIPLSFWFCKKLGLAFPLIALQNDTLSLTIKLNKFDDCAYIESLPTFDQNDDPISPAILALSLSDIWDNLGLSLTGTLLVDYVYLDTLERRRFAQSSHEYLIETVQTLSLEDLSDPEQTVTLDFDGPSKELIWSIKKNSYINNNSTNIKMPFNYSLTPQGIGNPISTSLLMLNGVERFNNKHLNGNYFNYVQPHYHHNKTPADGINMYSFSLFPEEHQPSCSCNFSKIENPRLIITLDPSSFLYNLSDIDPVVVFGSDQDEILETTININIYSLRYNIIRIIGGMGGLAYQYIS